MKRSLTIVVFLLVVLAGGYFYFSGNNLSFSKDTSIYKALPVTTPFFFEFTSADAIPINHPVMQKLAAAEIGTAWFDFLHKTDSLVKTSKELPSSLKSSPFILSYDFTGRNQLIPLIIKKTESSGRKRALEKLIKSFYPPGEYSYSEKDYANFQITEVNRGGQSGPFYYSFVNDLFLVCPKSIPIEQVIRQVTIPGILKDPNFLKVNKSAGNDGISFYLNHSTLSGFFGKIFNRNNIEKVDEFGSTRSYRPAVLAEKFKNFASWSELDFHFSDDLLLLSGISAANDSLNNYLSVFEDQQSSRFNAENVLPQNTSFFCSYTFPDKKTFFERLETYFSHSNDYYHREERMKRFDLGMRTNLRSVFQDLIKDEIIVAATTIPVNPENKTTYFILHTEGRSSAEKKLKEILSNYAERKGIEPAEMVTDFTVDNEVHFPVYRFPYPSFPGLWIGSPFAMAEARYVSFKDNYMVFSNSESGLHEYLRSMVLETSLSNDVRYKKFRQNISNRANINVYVDVNKAFSFRNEVFAENLLKQIDNKEEEFRRFGMINWQVHHEKEIFLNSMAVAFQSDAREEAQTTWQSTIGSNISFKPQLVLNHDDLNNLEIIFQDNNNMLHQVSNSGRVRWSIELSGPVLSEIHQVDYFKNRKYQYLFNTKEKLYLIDRNGNNVSGFPLTFRSPATNGVNVFDYDKSRDYRYFVASEDHKITAYDYEGKVISGWKFEKTDHPVTTPVKHFRVENKDYIVFKDRTRIYIQDRQGETRVSTSAIFENSANPLILNLDGKPKIVATDAFGKVYYIYFDGTYKEIVTERFSENHFFNVDDLDGNGIPDFIFVDGNTLTVINENGKKLFTKKMDNHPTFPPDIYSFSSSLKKVGLTSANSNRIYLFNPDGKPHEGFPLQGNSPFSIGKLNNNSDGLNLIVGGDGGKLYNYSLYQ